MRPRYCRSADARMRMQNALLLQWCRIRQSTGWDFHTVQKYILKESIFHSTFYYHWGEENCSFKQGLH